MKNIADIMRESPLAKLVGASTFVGWVYAIDYDRVLIMTNDIWKESALGVPHNCFLLAASFDPNNLNVSTESDIEVILLRVIGSGRLPQDDDLIRTKIDHYQQRTAIHETSESRRYDDITLNQLQFGGLECRVLGTFYMAEGLLRLGSDLESFASAASLNVYRPRGHALETIVNYVDPVRMQSVREQAQVLGITNAIQPFRIGTVRYTSTERLHRGKGDPEVNVCIQPSDFLARRTAVLGMTRTGKSNMIKQLVSVVKKVADEAHVPIGQIIYDINGEYANANLQDRGALADVYPADTLRYRMLETPGFLDLRNNFYEDLAAGFAAIRRELEDARRIDADYIRAFVNISLDEPDPKEVGEHKRWQVRVAAYRTLLFVAGFTPPFPFKVTFSANDKVKKAVEAVAGTSLPDPAKGLGLPQAQEWFTAARDANRVSPLPSSTSGKQWVDDTLKILLDMIAQKSSENNSYISGHRILSDARKYHSPTRSAEVAEEIYGHLEGGKIVILDLSVGDATMREKISKQIAGKIFRNSMQSFISGKTPPNIVVYIEEAHNLIGKGMDLVETWPRLAKEGAKYRIALVYATQEVSSVHPNILANTENWFITHLNNEREVRELAQFYDFADFSRSLMRAQDVGFARVKTLSSPFVIPTQIAKFDPVAIGQSPTSTAAENDGLREGAEPHRR